MEKNPFVKAEASQRYLKLLIYGDSGTGKTFFALNSPRPCAVIDLEAGTAHYGQHKTIGGFDRITTKSLKQIEEAIKFCESGHYKTLVIDPITMLWDLLQQAGITVAQGRARGKSEYEIGLTVKDWGILKKKYSSLMTALVNLPCHVILTARSKDLVEVQANGNIRQIGVKAEGEKGTLYWMDIILHLEMLKDQRFATVKKDRTGLYQTGDHIDNPILHLWQAGYQSGKADRLVTDEEVDAENAATLAVEYGEAPAPPKPQQAQQKKNGNNPKTPAPTEEWKRLMALVHAASAEYGLDHDDLHTLLGVEHLADADQADLRDLPGSLKLWAEADRKAGVPEKLAHLREDLESAGSLEEMAEKWQEWSETRAGWSRLAKLQAGKIKDAAKALYQGKMMEVAVP